MFKHHHQSQPQQTNHDGIDLKIIIIVVEAKFSKMEEERFLPTAQQQQQQQMLLQQQQQLQILQQATANLDPNSISILIDAFKNDDLQVRLHSIRRLQVIAKALGPARVREELIPYLNGE